MFFFIVSRLFQLWKERQISCDAMIYVSCSLFQKGEKRWNSEMISLKCFLRSENCPSRWPSTSPSTVAQAAPAAALCLGSYSVWGQCLRSVFEVTCSLDTRQVEKMILRGTERWACCPWEQADSPSCLGAIVLSERAAGPLSHPSPRVSGEMMSSWEALWWQALTSHGELE